MGLEALTLDYIKIVVELGGGGAAIAVVLVKMGRMTGTFEQLSVQQTQEIAEIHEELKTVREMVTAIAVQKVMMENMQVQITTVLKWYDELRHGKGLIRNED